MAAAARAATEYARLTALSQDLQRQTRELKAQKRVAARKEARRRQSLFSVALCVLAVSGSRIEVLERYWRREGADEDMVQEKVPRSLNIFWPWSLSPWRPFLTPIPGSMERP